MPKRPLYGVAAPQRRNSHLLVAYFIHRLVTSFHHPLWLAPFSVRVVRDGLMSCGPLEPAFFQLFSSHVERSTTPRRTGSTTRSTERGAMQDSRQNGVDDRAMQATVHRRQYSSPTQAVTQITTGDGKGSSTGQQSKDPGRTGVFLTNYRVNITWRSCRGARRCGRPYRAGCAGSRAWRGAPCHDGRP